MTKLSRRHKIQRYETCDHTGCYHVVIKGCAKKCGISKSLLFTDLSWGGGMGNCTADY